MIKFNTNSYVYFKLTAEGLTYLTKSIEAWNTLVVSRGLPCGPTRIENYVCKAEPEYYQLQFYEFSNTFHPFDPAFFVDGEIFIKDFEKIQ